MLDDMAAIVKQWIGSSLQAASDAPVFGSSGAASANWLLMDWAAHHCYRRFSTFCRRIHWPMYRQSADRGLPLAGRGSYGTTGWSINELAECNCPPLWRGTYIPTQRRIDLLLYPCSYHFMQRCISSMQGLSYSSAGAPLDFLTIARRIR